ncbi:MAG: bifunctional diaminohydroxyphosphoribosylaminopyrimidine deaminase/5-amino-6-(5-phosphoribosylamino)uracil reductase RibD [Myxococcales bacterium]|nr:bifunctional diaminohydroxyphosphoribosylaminopyrimidine deaminase/5-amino-6-(5-phosphoribosylamino)uracil reductase RibD [Myxococcales bacterium]
MSTDADRHWMARALGLAHIATGSTAPNPPVGAVLVRDGSVLGEGWTRPIGGPHAEVAALQDCAIRGHDPRGATLYVTLEPCCHQGRTPPCSDALIAAGVSRVVVGVLDPFPAMRGQSVEQMEAAGLSVAVGVEEDACARQILGFARALSSGLPEVTSKVAMTLDGHIATASGESQWISGPQARQDGHVLRAHHDAILVGIGTVVADDPRLTCRLPAESLPGGSVDRDPVPVVLDSQLRVPAEARVLQSRDAVVVCAEDAPKRELSARVVRVARGPHGLDVVAALRALVDLGLHRILVEGGGHVHRALLDAAVVDTLQVYVAGLLLPGGRPWVAGPTVERLAEGVRMDLADVVRLGPDVRLTYALRHAIAPDPLAALRHQRTTPAR